MNTSPLDVVTAALAVHPPCPVCGLPTVCRCLPPEGYDRTRAHAELVVAALVEHGHLPRPAQAPSRDEVEELARWLAGASRFPRYTVEGGWQRIMAADADVNVAAAYAARNCATDAEREDVSVAKGVLLRWLSGGGS